VDLDLLQQLDVALRPGELDPDLGPGPLQAAVLHELPPLLLHDDPAEVGVWRQRPPAAEARDLRVDVVDPALAGHGHPVVPVDDEVRAAELEHGDRREVALVERPLHPLPSGLDVPPAREELPVEVPGPPERPHDPRHRDGADPYVRLLEHAETLANVVQVEQRLGFPPSDHVGEPLVGLAPTRPPEGGGRPERLVAHGSTSSSRKGTAFTTVVVPS
jgi:hypothetical protein